MVGWRCPAGPAIAALGLVAAATLTSSALAAEPTECATPPELMETGA
jgi:hypothetical protein